jgi:hypothetical protein
MTRAVLASLIGAAGTLSLAVTSATATAGGAITYAGTAKIDDSNDGRDDGAAMPLSITIQGHRITNYQFFASLRCTDGSFSNVGVYYDQQSSAPIAFTGNHFAVTVGNPSTGSGMTARITGTVAPRRHVVGHILVDAHADSGVTPSGPLCTSAYNWIARWHRLVPPAGTTPPSTEPSVALTLVPVREPLTASAYKYGVAVSNVACTGGAVAFRVSVGALSATLTCAQAVPRPLTNAFFGLDAGRTYEAIVQPQVRTAGGLVAKGPTKQLGVSIPPPGSPEWHPVPGA